MVTFQHLCFYLAQTICLCILYYTSLHGGEWGGFKNPVPLPVYTMHHFTGEMVILLGTCASPWPSTSTGVHCTSLHE